MEAQVVDVPSNGAVWMQRWKATLESCTRLGGMSKDARLAASALERGEILPVRTEFSVAPPATEAEVCAAEKELGCKIPAELLLVLTQFSAEVDFGWFLPIQLDRPAILRYPNWGGCDWSLKKIVHAEQFRREYEEEFGAQNLFAFLWTSNEDLLAIRTDAGPFSKAPVVYVNHEREEHHLRVLGSSFLDFMDRWTKVGCAGPEWWQLETFLEAAGGGVISDSENAQLWCKSFFGAFPESHWVE